MSTMGSRIIEELSRLDIKSSKYSKLVGVTERSQYNYENDIRKPKTEYWEESAKIGMDVLYVITGKRAVTEPEQTKTQQVTKEELLDTLELIRKETEKGVELVKKMG